MSSPELIAINARLAALSGALDADVNGYGVFRGTQATGGATTSGNPPAPPAPPGLPPAPFRGEFGFSTWAAWYAATATIRQAEHDLISAWITSANNQSKLTSDEYSDINIRLATVQTRLTTLAAAT